MIEKERIKLKSIKLSGYKSIAFSKNPDEILFGDINVIIGANGSGKSNFVSLFEMLDRIFTENLQLYVGQQGNAQSLLHYGSKVTKEIFTEITSTNGKSIEKYRFKLTPSVDDNLIFNGEEIEITDMDGEENLIYVSGSGYKESNILYSLEDKSINTEEIMLRFFKSCKIFQFHDTSAQSYMRRSVYVENEKELYGDGSNLAPYLYTLKNTPEYKKYYNRIIKRIRLIMPQFADFALEPTTISKDPHISLNWKSITNQEYVFGPHQLSDGSLRFMALATLLLQPPEKFPKIIIIDEPELGLHPTALSVLAGMIRTASQHSQVIIATQSTRLVDEFDCEDIIVAEWDTKENSSKFKRLDKDQLGEWLEDYSLSELWEKNVLGGQP